MGRIAELRSLVRGIPLGTIWVCQCCMLSHANGECCADDEHGGDGIEPWATTDFARYSVSMGLSWDEHSDGCEMRDRDRLTGSDECDCEHIEFSSAQCEGCGSWLAGDRFAFGLWREPQRFRSGIAAAHRS